MLLCISNCISLLNSSFLAVTWVAIEDPISKIMTLSNWFGCLAKRACHIYFAFCNSGYFSMERDIKSFRWSFDYYISYNFFLMLSFILVFMTIILQKQKSWHIFRRHFWSILRIRVKRIFIYRGKRFKVVECVTKLYFKITLSGNKMFCHQ